MEKIDISEIFGDAEAIYREAVANVRENGAVCAHPRTGTPIENPYLKIMAQFGLMLSKMIQTAPVSTNVSKHDPYQFLKGKK